MPLWTLRDTDISPTPCSSLSLFLFRCYHFVRYRRSLNLSSERCSLRPDSSKLLIRLFPQPLWHLIIDDTLILRTSRKAPGSKIFRQHSRKPNRPEFVRGQFWVSLAAVVENGLSAVAIPILSRLMRKKGNGSKLTAAKALIRVIAPAFDNFSVRLLLDSCICEVHCSSQH
jgi:hypothetical protein